MTEAGLRSKDTERGKYLLEQESRPSLLRLPVVPFVVVPVMPVQDVGNSNGGSNQQGHGCGTDKSFLYEPSFASGFKDDLRVGRSLELLICSLYHLDGRACTF